MTRSTLPRYLYLRFYRFFFYRYIFENLIERSCKQNTLILDAGCGKGSSLSFQPNGVEFVGIDLSPNNIVACRKRWRNRDYVVADLTALPFKKDTFKGALSADVLEHVDDKNASIMELARITMKGGFFVGCSSNLLNPALFVDTKLPLITNILEKKFVTPGHYGRHTRFSPSSLKKVIESTGYTMDGLYLLGHPLFSASRSPLVFSLLWVFFDMVTNKKPFSYLKEALIWQATRK